MASTPARDSSFYRSRLSSASTSIRMGLSFLGQRGLLLTTFLATTALSLSFFGQSLWRDEASSLWFARLPLGTLLMALCDPHPPGYYLLLKAWLVGGEQEFWLRLPSLLAAVIAVALTYRLGREACGYRCAWLAALLLALYPLQSWYAAEMRMYMLVQALGLLLVWLGWRLLSVPAQQTPRPGEIVAYWVVALVALCLDYAALLPVGLLQLLWLARGLPHARRWLSLQVAALLPTALLWSNFSQLQVLHRSYQAVFVAVQASRLGFDLTPAVAAYLLQLVVAGLTLASVALAWYGFRRSGRWLDRPLVQLLLLGGWLALLVLAALPRAYTVKRQLIVLLPYLALLVGYGLARLPRPTGELVAGLGLLVTLLILPNHQREPWRAIVANLVQTELDQATVIWVDDQSVPAFDYYLRSSIAAAKPVQWQPLLGHTLPRLPTLAPQSGGTLWIVTVVSDYRRLITLLPEEFHRHYQLLETQQEASIALYHYRRRTQPIVGQIEVAVPSRPGKWGLFLPSPLDKCQAVW